MKKALPHRCLSLIMVLTGWVIAGCAGHMWWPSALADYQVTSRGHDAGGEYCADFSLTPAHARWFFGRAKRLRAAREHARLDKPPCWVRGTAQGMDGTWRWEIRAGGSALLVAPDGAEQILGCSNCRAILPRWHPPKLP
jgi:hypothetical protein